MERIEQKRMTASLPPERVLQFGEGNFLRAFIDWMFHRMNESGVFGGSAVVVQPLENGQVDLLNEQQGLYTLYLRGIQNGEQVDDHEVIRSISRGINPYSDWEGFLETAANPDMRFVVSNTTEAGIAYQRVEPPDSCPATFPAKLTAWLVRRFEQLGGSADSAMIFLPCELINYNGRKLKECILKHSADWKLGGDFEAWIENDCIFLSTLVDRIVPGYPHDEAEAMQRELGYTDHLICTGEIFHLLVIEGPEELKAELPFHKAGLNVVWTDDMQPYRNLKVSILNGAHTSSVLAAYLGGLDIVREMVEDGLFGRYVQAVLFNEIIPTLDVEREEAEVYAGAVLERFRNPFIRHELLSISLNSVSKWKVRVLPSVKNYMAEFGKVPSLLAFSMAALIAFYKGDLRDSYEPKDDPAVLEFFRTAWSGSEVVARVLEHTDFWGEDLTALPGFELEVSKALGRILHGGMREAVKDWLDHEDA
ncbi:tagaturonate reductase [Pontiella agarivorans]|uniref:Tagaturonate reductase n=1 Tax=Pontiella agarivorans TaxID=3038953 RepID=A0ABU5N254_9BACT|nr:tagaturonate reductase [Pontiella agarivorans]MDZ8120515.1 tagaturonate reductase [Pontiella agarivorans]